MKKIILLSLLFVAAFSFESKSQNLSNGYYSIIKDSVVTTTDTVLLKPGLTVVVAADSIATLRLKFPNVSGAAERGVVHSVLITKPVNTISYLNGTTVGGPTKQASSAINATINTLNTGKISFVYSKLSGVGLWYRIE